MTRKSFPVLDAADLHDAALQVWGGVLRRIDLVGAGPDVSQVRTLPPPRSSAWKPVLEGARPTT
jgi:hypothetical protein